LKEAIPLVARAGGSLFTPPLSRRWRVFFWASGRFSPGFDSFSFFSPLSLPPSPSGGNPRFSLKLGGRGSIPLCALSFSTSLPSPPGKQKRSSPVPSLLLSGSGFSLSPFLGPPQGDNSPLRRLIRIFSVYGTCRITPFLCLPFFPFGAVSFSIFTFGGRAPVVKNLLFLQSLFV